MINDYSNFSEITGSQVTKEQLQRIYTRYLFAAEYCKGKDILEVACGSGQGLGLLTSVATTVTAGDVTEKLVRLARCHYQNRVIIDQINAHKLPYSDHRFDVVILFEAIYFLKTPEQFIQEAKRVLRPKGTLLICSANRSWRGFSPCVHTHQYYDAPELYTLLKKQNFDVTLFGDCPVTAETPKDKVISFIRNLAAKLHLFPKTMKTKEKLKRLFFGKLIKLEPELKENITNYTRPTRIDPSKPNKDFKVIFAIGTLH
jgi:ubiquinone/menaquinone biosynthesis C-methylase UbiE